MVNGPVNGVKHVIKASKRTLEIEYAIRDVTLPARELEKKGHKILKLNIGDPCAYDFDTPEPIKAAVKKAMEHGKNGYTPSEGIPELLDAIVEKERRDGVEIKQSDIVVTTGVTESLLLLFAATFEEGDEILVPGPAYPPYVTYIKLNGAKPVPYRTIEEENWAPDIDDLKKKITPKTKAIAVITPNNPTGALYKEKVLKEICDIVAEHPQMYLISDEIYDMMVYDDEFVSPGKINKEIPMVIFNGISKGYLAPGWRIGYMAFRDPSGALSEIREGVMRQARARLCASSICQYGYHKALMGAQSHLEALRAKLKERRDFAYKRINEIPGLSTQKPGGAFYIFPKIEVPYKSDKQFVLDILENCHVLLVHGSGFCETYGKGHFRAVFLPPIEMMSEAFDRIENYMRKLKS